MNIRPLIAGASIGAVLGLAIGFVAYKATGGFWDFVGWITPGLVAAEPRDALLWAIGGAIVGAAAVYIRGAISN